MGTPIRLISLVTVAVAAFATAACAVRHADQQLQSGTAYSIYVVRRGLHTGIAVPTAYWPDQTWSVLADFPDSRYLELGWGDAAYYQAETKTLGMTLAAVFWPTSSVMEVLGLTDVSREASSDYEAVEMHLSEEQMEALAASITASFSGGAVTPTGRVRRYPEGMSRFYLARGKFHLFRTCNRWTAKRLEAIGCAIRPWPVLAPSRVLREAQRCEASHLPQWIRTGV